MSQLYGIRDTIARARDRSAPNEARHYSIAVTAVEGAILRVLAAEARMAGAPRS